MIRPVLVALAVIAGVVLITLAAGLVPGKPPRCEIPGHARTTTVECEHR